LGDVRGGVVVAPPLRARKSCKMLKYTLLHKWYVFTYCLVWGIPLRGILHDWSKFIPWIYRAYRRWFYGDWPSSDDAIALGRVRPGSLPKWVEWTVKESFDRARCRHQKLERHHWQFWLLVEDDRPVPRALEMPYKDVKSMVANWLGAARVRHAKEMAIGEVRHWYLERRYKLVLHPKTRATVEYLLNVFSDIVGGDHVALDHWKALRRQGEQSSPGRMNGD
jgi:hypothetical protein